MCFYGRFWLNGRPPALKPGIERESAGVRFLNLPPYFCRDNNSTRCLLSLFCTYTSCAGVAQVEEQRSCKPQRGVSTISTGPKFGRLVLTGTRSACNREFGVRFPGCPPSLTRVGRSALRRSHNPQSRVRLPDAQPYRGVVYWLHPCLGHTWTRFDSSHPDQLHFSFKQLS